MYSVLIQCFELSIEFLELAEWLDFVVKNFEILRPSDFRFFTFSMVFFSQVLSVLAELHDFSLSAILGSKFGIFKDIGYAGG